MYLGIVLISLFTIVLPAEHTPSNTQINYQVSEVSRISWPSHFTCKINNYEPSKVVNFRVYWGDIGIDPADEAAKEFLIDLLKSSDQIELYDVQFRNYFRLNAKIRINGQPLTDFLIDQKMVPAFDSQEQSPGASKAVKQKYPTQISAYWSRKSAPKTSTSPVFVKRRTVKMQDLLDTVVDCSMITDQTSLSEALQILSTSVDPPLPLVILWKDLKINALIEKDTPIGVSGLHRMKAGQALKIILRSVSLQGPKLGIVSEGGILKLATQQTLQKDKKTKVYSIEDLVGVQSVVNELFGSGSQQGGYQR